MRSSHERLDGGGYPDGLAGDDIPLAARIVFVCDSFDAMTSDRPYARGRPAGVALAELRRHAGTQFDPEVVEAFASALAQAGAGGPGGAATTPGAVSSAAAGSRGGSTPAIA